MFSNVAPKRITLMVAAWLVGLAAILLLSAAPAFASGSAQQVYETPEAGETPSPLPELPGPPSGNQQQPPPFTPQVVPGPGPTPPTPVVAGSRVPETGPYPCIPAEGAGTGSGTGSTPGAAPGVEECAEVPGDGTAVRNSVSPGPGESVPVGEVAPESGPAPGAGGDTLPVTGLDLLIILAAAVTAAGVGASLRKAAR